MWWWYIQSISRYFFFQRHVYNAATGLLSGGLIFVYRDHAMLSRVFTLFYLSGLSNEE